MKRLQNKNAVIVGGTSGIGFAIAEAFVREGAAVMVLSRSRKNVQRAEKKLAALGNAVAEGICLDVTSERSVDAAHASAKKVFKHIDVLVCTAGCHLKKDFNMMTVNEWDLVMATNLRGTFLVNRVFGRDMLKRKKGSIINVSSLGAAVALSKAAAYSVSKAGVSMLTKALAVEWAPGGVRVNALLPGVFPTPLNAKALQDSKRRRRIIDRTPMARMGKTAELAGAALYLASDESAFVTGTELVVDGGFLASSGF